MKVLIIKTSSLGDIIHAFSVLQYLKKKFPGAVIDWVVEKPFKELLESHTYVDKVILIESKKWRKNLFKKETFQELKKIKEEIQSTQYDYVFDLQGNMKSGLVMNLSRGKQKIGYGWKTVSEFLNVFFSTRRFNPPRGKNIREDYLYLVQSAFEDFVSIEQESHPLVLSHKQEDEVSHILSKLPKKFRMMICPGSAWKNKQVSEESLISFMQKLQILHDGHFLIIWGNQVEYELANKLKAEFGEHARVIDRLELPELFRLMQNMDLVIAVDSFPLHLAGIAGIPTFSIFGPSSAKKYKPLGTVHESIEGKCPFGITFEKRCPKLRKCASGACIKGLSGEILFDTYLTHLTRRGA